MKSGMPPFAGTDDSLTERIICVFYQVANEIGFGFLESVYCRSLAIALAQAGLAVQTEFPLEVLFRGQSVGVFRADLVVEGRIILEVKTGAQIIKAHEAQLLHYLRSCLLEVGLILNFGTTAQVRRLEFRNENKASHRKSG
jgi:GxxExxY protein